MPGPGTWISAISRLVRIGELAYFRASKHTAVVAITDNIYAFLFVTSGLKQITFFLIFMHSFMSLCFLLASFSLS